MHDPSFVAAEVVRPWPSRSSWHDAKPGQPRWKWDRYKQRKWWRPNAWSRFCTLAGRGYYWPALITVWHNEPGGRDAGEVCGYPHGWKLLRHLRHVRVQFHPLGHFRRWALTRCAWCGGRSLKTDPVNCSHQWDGPRGKWWQGEPDLFHGSCSSVHSAHQTCICADPLLRQGDYGTCLVCGLGRAWRHPDDDYSDHDDAIRIVKTIPPGGRMTPEVKAAIEPLWRAHRERLDNRRERSESP